MSTHFFKISLCYDKKWENKVNVSQLISIVDFQRLGMSTYAMIKNGK